MNVTSKMKQILNSNQTLNAGHVNRNESKFQKQIRINMK